VVISITLTPVRHNLRMQTSSPNFWGSADATTPDPAFPGPWTVTVILHWMIAVCNLPCWPTLCSLSLPETKFLATHLHVGVPSIRWRQTKPTIHQSSLCDW